MINGVAPHELPANVLFTMIVVPVLNWAKQHPKLAWVTPETARLVSIIVAGLGELGIHASYNAAAGSATITLTVAGVISGLLLWGKEALGQHWTYKIYSALDAAPALITAVKTLATPPADAPTSVSPNP